MKFYDNIEKDFFTKVGKIFRQSKAIADKKEQV